MPPATAVNPVDFCASIQHRDGSFDQCYPVERTPGVVYDMLPALTYVLRSPHLRSAHARANVIREAHEWAGPGLFAAAHPDLQEPGA